VLRYHWVIGLVEAPTELAAPRIEKRQERKDRQEQKLLKPFYYMAT